MKGFFKKNKGYIFTGLFLVIFAIGIFAGQRAFTQDGETVEESNQTGLKIKVFIDEKCELHPEKLIVPEGKTAYRFSAGDLKPGKACRNGGKPDNKGFAIRDSKNRPVYLWSQYKDSTPYETGGPFPNLELETGEYSVSVAGGAGAEIEISYFFKIEELILFNKLSFVIGVLSENGRLNDCLKMTFNISMLKIIAS